jgi:hypothetical protein
MQPPPRAEPGILNWTSAIWVARAPDGRQTADLVSLSQMSRAFLQGTLEPDVEAAIVGEWAWENIRIVLARYASLAPTELTDVRNAGDPFGGAPEFELTLTMQRDLVGRSYPAHGALPPPTPPPMPASMPPPPPPRPMVASHFPPNWIAAPSLGEVFHPSLATPLPARLASLLYGVALFVAALVALVSIIAAFASLFSRLNDATEPRLVVLGLLVALAWLLGGGTVAAVVLLLGRAAAGVVLVASRIDEKLRDGLQEGRKP